MLSQFFLLVIPFTTAADVSNWLAFPGSNPTQEATVLVEQQLQNILGPAAVQRYESLSSGQSEVEFWGLRNVSLSQLVEIRKIPGVSDVSRANPMIR